MNRHSLRLFVVLVLLLVSVAPAADSGTLDPDVLKAALRTATPQEEGFIERVVTMVDQGKLPLDMLQSTFLWARKKPRKKFFYFKQALILRAADKGIKVSQYLPSHTGRGLG